MSTSGGTQPMWAPNGRELFYVDPNGRVMTVPIQPGPGFTFGNPQVVVEGPFATILPGMNGRMYDVSRDGQRFLVLKGADSGKKEADPPPQIVVVQNWDEELLRLAPTN